MTLLPQVTNEPLATRQQAARGRTARDLPAATREVSHLDSSLARIAGRLGES